MQRPYCCLLSFELKMAPCPRRKSCRKKDGRDDLNFIQEFIIDPSHSISRRSVNRSSSVLFDSPMLFDNVRCYIKLKATPLFARRIIDVIVAPKLSGKEDKSAACALCE